MKLSEMKVEKISKKDTPPIKMIVKGEKGLGFEEIIALMIHHAQNSDLRDYKQIGIALEEGDRNAQFQSKRIKDAIRMLFDMKLKISK